MTPLRQLNVYTGILSVRGNFFGSYRENKGEIMGRKAALAKIMKTAKAQNIKKGRVVRKRWAQKKKKNQEVLWLS